MYHVSSVTCHTIISHTHHVHITMDTVQGGTDKHGDFSCLTVVYNRYDSGYTDSCRLGRRVVEGAGYTRLI